MKHLVCYSGGHSSALVAIEVTRRYGQENTILLNHNIHPNSEHADIKRFKEQVADYLHVPITYANMGEWDKKDQFDVVIEAGAFKVGTGTALCTNRMKTRPFEEYLTQEFPTKEAVIYYGFDAKEKARIQRRSSHLALLGFASDYPLALWEERTIYSTDEIGISQPNTYNQFKHANCTGCLKAGKQHWYVVYCTRPDIWAKGRLAEDLIGYTICAGTSLEELEPLFEKMRCLGIPATEHIPFQTFWATVRKALKEIPEQLEEQDKPCECVF